MFHVAGVTPEAGRHSPAGLKRVALNEDSLRSALSELTTATDHTVGLVSLGNPHFSIEEFAYLSQLCAGRHKGGGVQMIITTNREVYTQACAAGEVSILESFGAEILTDTCWCMIPEEIIDGSVRNLMTNSAKYAHYAPGIVHRGVHFGSLRDCVHAAETGRIDYNE
jgi:predicted aconitase